MIYQLKSGKIIHISTEQFFDLSDAELESLEGMNVGSFPPASPWSGSFVTKKVKPKEEEEKHDTSIDFSEESEEFKTPPINFPEDFDDDDLFFTAEEIQDLD